MTGYETSVKKDLATPVSPGNTVNSGWVTVFEWTALPEGPTILEFEVAAELDNPRPSDIQTRLLRPGNDATKRKTHGIGTVKAWADVVTYVEFLNPGDLPLAFQVWCKGSGLTVVKVIAKAFAPAAYVGGKLA